MFRDPAALAEGTAREVIRIVAESLERRGRCALALAGGSTPRELYETLSQEPFLERLDWSRLDLFWGDERCVPPDHPASNYAMAREALLSRVPIPEDRVHRIRGELDPLEAANLYERELRSFAGGALPRLDLLRLDLVLLGLGADGHTASLFPETPDLLGEERLAVPTLAPQTPRNRISLTLPVFNAARTVMFLVQGAGKADVLLAVLEGESLEGPPLPAALVRPRTGRLLWMLDRAAAAKLRRGHDPRSARRGPPSR